MASSENIERLSIVPTYPIEFQPSRNHRANRSNPQGMSELIFQVPGQDLGHVRVMEHLAVVVFKSRLHVICIV